MSEIRCSRHAFDRITAPACQACRIAQLEAEVAEERRVKKIAQEYNGTLDERLMALHKERRALEQRFTDFILSASRAGMEIQQEPLEEGAQLRCRNLRPEISGEVRLALKILLNHVQPGWDNCRAVVQAWLEKIPR
jgi:hypothetical protein